MKLCPYPFSRLQTSNYHGRFQALRGTFIPCVPSWLFDSFYFKNPRASRLEEIWNGPAAIELRKRMYEGDFSFCNRKACQIPLFSVEELADWNNHFCETPIPLENIEAIKQKSPVMPKGPVSLLLTSDYTCNLSCPICRSKFISNNEPPTQEAIEEYDYVWNNRLSIEVVKMSNGGEVFYSNLQRKLLKRFNAVDFPRLRRIHIVSNGTLFSERNYNELRPGTEFIKDVCISIDAGSKAVYEKVRRANWEQTLRNVEWLGSLRGKGTLDYYSFHIIIVKENFRDLPQMISLAKDNGVDRVLVQPFLNGQEIQYNYKEQAIHLPEHPDYQEFIDLMVKYRDEKVLYTYLDIPGFSEKISKDIEVKQALNK